MIIMLDDVRKQKEDEMKREARERKIHKFFYNLFICITVGWTMILIYLFSKFIQFIS